MNGPPSPDRPLRIHVVLDAALVAAVDALAGRRGRSGFIRDAVQEAVERRRRWAAFEQAAGAAPAFGEPDR